jgi:plastocyanin
MWRNSGLAAMLLGLCANLCAAELTVRLTNATGAALADAVVFDPGATAVTGSAALRKRETIVQRNRLFDPFVTVVEKGAAISFPNEDPMLHHVYSFSPAKRFEIKLYKGTPAAPVVFDKTGVVALGCNVHDWMLAYILVIETPVFGKSGKDGVVRLSSLAAGTHELMVWYPGMREPMPLQSVALAANESRMIDHRLSVAIRTQPKAPPLDPMRYSLLKGEEWPFDAQICTAAGS